MTEEPEIAKPREDIEPIYRSLMARNVKAFLEAKGQSIDLENTPEYLTSGAKLLRKTFGVDLAAFICRQEETKRFSRWCRGTDLPKQYESKNLLAAIEITEILLGNMSPAKALEWMISPCPYILNDLPMDYMLLDSDLVRKAALQNFL